MKHSLFRNRGFLVIALALALLLSACGKFSSSDSDRSASSGTTEPGEVGAGLGVASTQPLVTRAGAVTTAAPSAPAATDPCKTKPSSTTVTRDSRLKMVLNVSGVCFKRADNIGLSLVVTNTSSQTINYDANQRNFFTIRAPQGEQKRRWEDDDCVPPTGDGQKRALTLAPGATVKFETLYPAPQSVANRESCRRLETGDYDVHATFLVCDESFQDGYCDIAKDTQYRADPVNITLAS